MYCVPRLIPVVSAKTKTSSSENHNAQRMVISPLRARVVFWTWEGPVTPPVGVRRHHGAISVIASHPWRVARSQHCRRRSFGSPALSAPWP